MKVLFMGTPDFAVPSLKKLLTSKHTVVGVVAQPDRALKRGKIDICPVKKCALEAGLNIIQPEKIRNAVEELKSFNADIAVTAAYGQILSRDVLDAFRFGVINVHASLLPKYRGASPIQSAIMNNEKTTGVTIMKTELGLDCGDILGVKETEIGANETGGELAKRLSEIGAQLLIEVLDNFSNIIPVKQDEKSATHCSTIKKSEEYIDFAGASESVVNFIRALDPVPCAKTLIDGEVYKIYAAKVDKIADTLGKPGEILEGDKRLIIACGSGSIQVTELQAPGKRAMPADDFLRGRKLQVGTICGKPQ